MNTNTETPTPRLVPDRPSDYRLVPVEATDEMMNRAVAAMHAAPVDFMGRQGHAAFRAAYAAMLAAAPPAEAPAERGLPTDRRMRAVELLLSQGWKWDGNQWAAPAAPAEGWDWFRECRRVLDDVATEMRATGRGDSRFIRLIETMPQAPRVTGGREESTGAGEKA